MTQNELIACLVQEQKNLKAYGVKSLGVFGSFAKNTADVSSDVDLLVSFSRPTGLFQFLTLKHHLEDKLGRHVDLVTKPALHPHLKAKILKETVHVF